MKKILFSSFLLVWLVGNSATFRPMPCQPISPNVAIDASEEGCFLPKVTGKEVIANSSTSLLVKWDPVKGAAYFRIRCWDAVNSVLVRNVLVVAKPENNSVLLQDLIPGVLWGVQMSAVCVNGQESL